MIMQQSSSSSDESNFKKNIAGKDVEDADNNDELVRIHLDQSNYVVTQTLQKAILDSTYLSIEKLLSACDLKFSFGISYSHHHTTRLESSVNKVRQCELPFYLVK